MVLYSWIRHGTTQSNLFSLFVCMIYGEYLLSFLGSVYGHHSWSLRQMCLYSKSPIRALDSATQAGFSGQKDFAYVAALHCWGNRIVQSYGRYMFNLVRNYWTVFYSVMLFYTPSSKVRECLLFCILGNTWYCQFNFSHPSGSVVSHYRFNLHLPDDYCWWAPVKSAYWPFCISSVMKYLSFVYF